jgi:WXXGXW repeat (2 copies)
MRLFRLARLSLLALLVSLIPASSQAGIFISVGFAPPAMPVYVQPPCPEDGLMWIPGYWHYGEMGYYWVPGAWVPAPEPGFLWTPGYWGWGNGLYIFHEGYWGRHVGYYGGVNYGFGYMGVGFAGGEWRGGRFAYNTAVVNVNTTVIHNTYVNTTIVHNTTILNNSHTAYSGGPGGINHPATPEERVAEHEQHQPPSSVQQQHLQAAQHSPSSWAKNNGGHPTTLAVAKPFSPTHPMPEARNIGSQASGSGAGKSTLTPNGPHPNASTGLHNPQPSNPPVTHNVEPHPNNVQPHPNPPPPPKPNSKPEGRQ